MSKEFNVPPVIFPAGANPVPAPQNRRAPAAPFPGNPSIPFMSFDIGPATGPTTSQSPFTTTTSRPTTLPYSSPPIIGAGGTLNFADEPPLLEELGINTKQIWSKTISILNPIRVKSDLHEEADLSGPFLLLVTFGLFQLLAGKIHFGIILGWVTMSAMFLYVVFNMLAGRNGNLNLHRCVSLIGYCMMPMVILSALALFLPQGGAVVFGLAGVCVVWSTRVCTNLLVELSNDGDEHRGLIAYACFLVYALFSLLIVF